MSRPTNTRPQTIRCKNLRLGVDVEMREEVTIKPEWFNDI